MACPIVNYGIPSDGATEYNINTGRELFRCGLDCVKLFITNVSLDKNTVLYICGDIADAHTGDVCMQSASANWKDQNIVNWIAKDGVTTALESGYVITLAGECSGASAATYTHTEGQINARVVANFEDINNSRDQIINTARTKLTTVGTAHPENDVLNQLQWVLSDINVNVSPTDWQSGSVSYQGFGSRANGERTNYRINFSWQNGRGEEAYGQTHYDTTTTPNELGVIVDNLIANS